MTKYEQELEARAAEAQAAQLRKDQERVAQIVSTIETARAETTRCAVRVFYCFLCLIVTLSLIGWQFFVRPFPIWVVLALSFIATVELACLVGRWIRYHEAYSVDPRFRTAKS